MFYDDNVDNLEVINTKMKEYDDSYVEVVPRNAYKYLKLIDNNEVLLTSEEISKYNDRIKGKTKAFYNLDSLKEMSKEEIYNLISNYSLPSLPKYMGSYIYTKENTKEILDNRNIDNIDNNIAMGLIIKRTNLRSFPTDKHFYSKKDIRDFDRLQETEVYVNTPVLILHESADGIWNFVVMPTYAGWVKKENIAISQEEDWEYFINNKDFVVVTEDEVDVFGHILNMGVKLPYKGIKDNAYLVDIPEKNEEGKVVKTSVTIKRNEAHVGYLPYTKRNIIIESFKYEGVPYSWGGMDEGIDCSSYIANIFKTFGFVFPRNTSSQRVSVGEIVSLENMSNQEKLDKIDDEYLSILYRIGHVMLYLGKINNVNYIIHANAKDMQVSVTPIDKDNLEAIDRLVLVRR